LCLIFFFFLCKTMKSINMHIDHSQLSTALSQARAKTKTKVHQLLDVETHRQHEKAEYLMLSETALY